MQRPANGNMIIHKLKPKRNQEAKYANLQTREWWQIKPQYSVITKTKIGSETYTEILSTRGETGRYYKRASYRHRGWEERRESC